MNAVRSPLVLFFAVVLVVGGGAWVVDQQLTADSFAETTGTVESAQLDSHEDTSARISIWGDREYEPNVTYTYTVDGQQHRNDRVSYRGDTESNMQWRISSLVSDYSSGAETTVHYNPDDPSTSYLREQFSFLPYVPLLLGLLVGAEYLTPGTYWIRRLRSVVSENSSSRRGDEWNDPESLDTESVNNTDNGAKNHDAPVSGSMAAVVWVGFVLLAGALLVQYALASARPYGLLLYAAIIGITVVAARAFLRMR
ncbi:hypothetical protein AUR64_19300 [Haloprofundus marisrubri]|uniref:DUF3592 domain-containing protein n=1 Tax=Haloprofundus marisrubri TaxID=1514971 RepID=A0A0W1R576_9EURY|nr:DUF3592 domain-containing protein [Haloprofundus marisrubri]KTG08380.1 hypothetical protein AUR64_19300 [Haloprofundus marisrubri]